MAISKTMYGTMEDGHWSCIYDNQQSVSMCGIKKVDIVKLTVTEDPKGEYWGWYEEEDNDISMIWKSLSALKMCFTYGLEEAEAKGKGRRIQLKIEKAI
jgi:hypothetical protein